MSDQNNIPADNVVLTNEEISKSSENRKKKRSTVTQQGVYRECILLLDAVCDISLKMPRRLVKLSDVSITVITELAKTICAAFELTGKEKIWAITDAIALVPTFKLHLAVFRMKNLISKDETQKIQGICNSINSQLWRWKNSIENKENKENNNPLGSQQK